MPNYSRLNKLQTVKASKLANAALSDWEAMGLEQFLKQQFAVDRMQERLTAHSFLPHKVSPP
jgi:hypothetical protein